MPDISITVSETDPVDVTVDGGISSAVDVAKDGSVVLEDIKTLDLRAGSNASLAVTDQGSGEVRAVVSATDSTLTDSEVQAAINEDGDHGSTASHNYYTAENARDDVGAALVGGSNVTVTTDDANDTITIDASGSTDTRTDIADSGGTVTTDATELTITASGAASVTVSDDGDGSATLDVSATDTDTTDHAQLTNVQSDQHHTKTTSAADLTDVSADSVADAHHADPTAGGGLTDEGTNQFGLDSVANGDATLSGGSVTVDTGHAINDTAEYTVFINPDDGADIAASLEEGGTNYQLHLEENTTSVGNPTCRWRLVRYA